ncbi:MAG TPA: protein kinase [Ktedonobacteraceae bacterium]|nr:protein kinase [Ktedonobacteraceae bacterium]
MADHVGQQFGHYQLTRLLGKGGFAEVYLGSHIYLGSEAAIKVILNELSDADKELFRIEGRTLVRLIHPHIVRLLDFGIENNIPYFVMDYAPNGSLREKHPHGTRLPLTTIVTYVNQTAGALQYAHDQKLIHRDVKPENMLLGQNNEVVLSDFGIAVVAHSTKSMRIEDIIGTSYYMAPEQLSGQPRTASDQYSLAVIVYSWFTGIFPFTGTYVEIVSQQLTKLPPPIRNIVPTIPVEVEQAVLKALEKDPQQRYETIQAFAQALEQACQNWIAPTVRANLPQQNQQQPLVSIQSQWQAPPQSAQLQKTKEEWFNEGNRLYNAKQFREAIAAYDQAITLDSKYADAYFNRGSAYSNLKEYLRAIVDYDRALAIDPNYKKAHSEAYRLLKGK